MMQSIGLESVAVSTPERVLTNDHWRSRYPQQVREAENRLWMWKKPMEWTEGSEAFNREMARYVGDPFRGARERRYLPAGDTALSLESAAARQALDAAGLGPGDVDLLICSSFLPDAAGVGGAAFLARELGLRGAAWNLESACSSSLIALQTACSLIAAGQHRRVLVVTSCTYSRAIDEDDPISWGVGDAATAMVVGAVEEGTGVLGSHQVHSGDTCDTVAYHLEVDGDGKPRMRLRTASNTAQVLRGTSERYLKECCYGAAKKAGVDLADVDHFVFNTPLAWYARFCSRALGVDGERTLSVYSLYANAGPALMGLNLLHAAHWREFSPGDLVLLYTVGSVSSCGAAVMRWSDVKLGSLPAGASLAKLEAYESEVRPPVAFANVA
ncbi:MAG: 3-oxoacyl-[acyl-carrier-protein] synthase III C-terminal domain-containing protein [Thermoanaerobaculia bacterium]